MEKKMSSFGLGRPGSYSAFYQKNADGIPIIRLAWHFGRNALFACTIEERKETKISEICFVLLSMRSEQNMSCVKFSLFLGYWICCNANPAELIVWSSHNAQASFCNLNAWIDSGMEPLEVDPSPVYVRWCRLQFRWIDRLGLSRPVFLDRTLEMREWSQEYLFNRFRQQPVGNYISI